MAVSKHRCCANNKVHEFGLDCVQAGSDDEAQAQPRQPAAIAPVPDLDPEATVMMTRKQRGLYNAMQRGISKKRQRAESLQAKAKKLKQPK